MRFGSLLLVFGLASCGSSSKSNISPAEPSEPTTRPESAFPLAAEATRGIENAGLAALLLEHWDASMTRSPVWATTRGDHRNDDKLGDNSDEAHMRFYREDIAFLDRAKALRAETLTASERTSLELLIERLEGDIAIEVCEGHRWQISAFGNAVAQVGSLPDRHKIDSEADAFNLLSRYRAIPTLIDRSIANLEMGAEKGLYANAESVTRAIKQIDDILSKPVEKWSLMSPAKDSKALAALSEAKKPEWLKALWEVNDGPIKEAFARYRAFLAGEILPKARGTDAIGINALPMGKECYQARIKRYLGIERTADQLHQLGLAEIKRINDEMRALGKKLFDEKDLGAITTRLRTDTNLYFKNRGEILTAARAALAAAREKTPEYFGIQPKADCVVTPIPDFEAPYSTIAYYRQPHADGSVPGQFFINTHKPSVRPRFEMRVLAYHEAIPGHHLQIAIAQEQGNLPAFRRSGGSTAYTEGWALYTERLSEEMGLYETDLDRMGMLSYDAWRAARLVVDTGIHAKGWTREKAEEFMREHTALIGANIITEVDRYINWPGQALAYKVGQLEILALRQEAREKLGDRFDIKAFHDVVLRDGAVTLPVLATNVRAWIASSQP